jgi:hypothetical protein
VNVVRPFEAVDRGVDLERGVVTRDRMVIREVPGNVRSWEVATSLALYATARKELEQKLVFPGSDVSWNLPYDHSIASHN